LDDHADRFELYRMLLEPLAEVKQHPTYIPKGMRFITVCKSPIATYHAGYDEEFVAGGIAA